MCVCVCVCVRYRLGLGLTEAQIQEMIMVFDADGNGDIEVRQTCTNHGTTVRTALVRYSPCFAFCVLCFACWVQMSEFLDLVNQPVIDVGAVARQQWLAERAKAEKAEEKLKQQVRPLD